MLRGLAILKESMSGGGGVGEGGGLDLSHFCSEFADFFFFYIDSIGV